ncbi:MAG: hypothetical protein RMJ35_11805, partial [Phycisphaerales bacterium]|nr:hypothetical protein [Phycisphaerales bacterium]
ELGLIQPQLQQVSTLGERAIHAQDIRGTAWFDDVVVAQVPKIRLSTDAACNVFPAGAPMLVHIDINDRATDDLMAQWTVRDAEGTLIFQNSQRITAHATRPLSAANRRLTTRLPDLPAGWYDLTVAMSCGGDALGERSIALIRLADGGAPIDPDPRLGLIATDLPFEAWDELRDLLPLLGAGRVKLPVWTVQNDVLSAGDAKVDDLLESLRVLGVEPAACLVAPPPVVAQSIGGNSWSHLLKSDRQRWQPHLAYVVSRLANRVGPWQLGSDDADDFASSAELRDVYDRIRTELRELLEAPELVVPWSAWYEPGANAPESIAMKVPVTVLPEQLPLYLRGAPGGSAGEDPALRAPNSISLELLPMDRYGRLNCLRDLAQRFTLALAAGARRIDVPLPYTVDRVDGKAAGRPAETLLVLRTLSMLLGNARFQAKVPIAENVEAFLFDRGEHNILVLWSRASDPTVRNLALHLGDRPVAVDLWGNVTPLLPGDPGRRSARVQLGPMPVVLLGIDGQQARLRASVAWDNHRIESSFRPQVRTLRFTNPCRTPISGQLRLRGPAGWILSPSVQQFSLNPGEEWSREISIEFPYNTPSGSKEVLVEFLLQDNPPGGGNVEFSVPLPLVLGLEDVGLQTIAFINGDDLLVQQIITNYGKKQIDCSAFVICPGTARQERMVTNLAPGRMTVRRYRFPGLAGTGTMTIRSGVRELQGVRMLNEEVQVVASAAN